MIEAEVKDANIQDRAVKFAAITGKSIRDVMTQQARLFVKDVVKLTPPFRSWSVRESFGEQRRMGELAVSRDIQRVFVPLENLKSYNADSPFGGAFTRAVDNRDAALLSLVMRNAYEDGGVTSKDLVDSADDAFRPIEASRHRAERNKRGKVKRRPRLYLAMESEIKRYIRETLKKVGMLKGGWCAAAAKYGVTLPNWIRRHASGSVVENFIAWNPSIMIRNDVDYISEQNKGNRLVNEALKRRDEAMARQIEAKLKGVF